MLQLAIDVGGTFTDVYVFGETDQDARVGKVPSTVDPIDAIFDGITGLGIALEDVSLFVHGTTVTTNALIQRSFPVAAMVTTAGFRDVIEIRRGPREHLWDPYKDVAPPYIRRRDRLEVTERVDYSGRVLVPLDEDSVGEAARVVRARGIRTVAVCLLNSYANPEHERQVKAILEKELPGATITASSDVLPEIFEHERFSTSVANAVLTPLVGEYVGRLAERLSQGGYEGDVLLLHSGGGVMTADAARGLGARLASSGLAAGAVAGAHIARLAGFTNAVALDMGGTSADISVMLDGNVSVTNNWYVEYGYPIRFPSVDVRTIGAGGGSIAWVDSGGSLHNGPQSAGAAPGPACYAQGGDAPTNTDANLLLGRLGDRLIGGALALDRNAAAKAVGEVANALELELTDAARAIIQVANANLADAIRVASIERGHDPRDFVLVAFGGAGPLHAAELAAELSIPLVVVPPNPGITSAIGCLFGDIRHDLAEMYLARTDEADPADLEGRFAALEERARVLLRREGVSDTDMRLVRSLDMRYVGRWRSLEVFVDGPVESLDPIAAQFRADHEKHHTYRRGDESVEIYQIRVTALGRTARKPDLPWREATYCEPSAARSRAVVFAAGEAIPTSVYARDALRPGARIKGPAIVEQLDSTTMIPPRDVADIDEWSNIRIRIGGNQ